MLLIRTRDELRRHIENLRSLAMADANANRKGQILPQFQRGQICAFDEVLILIKAWKDSDK